MGVASFSFTDQTALLKLCPRLVVEMVNLLNQVWVFARYRQTGESSQLAGRAVGP